MTGVQEFERFDDTPPEAIWLSLGAVEKDWLMYLTEVDWEIGMEEDHVQFFTVPEEGITVEDLEGAFERLLGYGLIQVTTMYGLAQEFFWEEKREAIAQAFELRDQGAELTKEQKHLVSMARALHPLKGLNSEVAQELFTEEKITETYSLRDQGAELTIEQEKLIAMIDDAMSRRKWRISRQDLHDYANKMRLGNQD